MCAKFDGLPLFVMGESMGGLLALLAGSGGDLDRLAGVLATCPAFLIPRQDGGVVDALVDYLPLDLLAQVFPKLPGEATMDPATPPPLTMLTPLPLSLSLFYLSLFSKWTRV